MDAAEQYRPRYHFTPPQNWMNDPNGLVYYAGEYHLFYQHNPYDKVWGHMSWGHAVSPDLVHWRHLPPAMLEAILEAPQQGYTIFSGSAVVDWHNTSGFGRDGQPPIVAAYTAHHPQPQRWETVHIAYSLDMGRTFAQYDGNPVVDVGNGKFGDPKIFWHPPSARWILVNILGMTQGRLSLYASPDLKNWQPLSDFEDPQATPGVWECPDMFALPLDGDPQRMKWIVKVNIGNQEPWIRGARYFVGEFDGYAFHNETPGGLMLNPDIDQLYAEATWNDIPAADNRRILIGWVRQTAHDLRPWTGMQSIPRTLALRSGPRGYALLQQPVAEMQQLRQRHYRVEVLSHPPSGDVLLVPEGDLPGTELEIQAEFLIPPGFTVDPAAAVGLMLDLGAGEAVRVGYDAPSGTLTMDRPAAPRLAIPLPLEEGRLRLHVFVDRQVVEVFGGAGEVTLTGVLEPQARCRGLGFYNQPGGARLLQMEVWALENAAQPEQ